MPVLPWKGSTVWGLLTPGRTSPSLEAICLKKIAAVSRLKKRDFKQPDKSPVAYNQQPFKLHGRMDLSIAFGKKTMVTPVYIKMDAHDQLLLSEGVCRQLDIVSYHPEVEDLNCQKKGEPPQVHLLKSFSLLPYQSAVVPVRATGVQGTHMFEPSTQRMASCACRNHS